MLRDDQIVPKRINYIKKEKEKKGQKIKFPCFKHIKDQSTRLNIKDFFNLKFEEPVKP